jgi:hypothetical protein
MAAALVAGSAALVTTGMAPASQTKTTKSYVLKLTIGMAEHMWTPAQVKAKHPTTGEVMLLGSMSSGMMGGSQRHLEVHITSRPTGKVVAGAHPAMTALDTSADNAMMITIPVVEMQGVTEGSCDLHYGNNVELTAGHVYKITVTLNGQWATFHGHLARLGESSDSRQTE